jgi:1-acyl-sn-glycerol-3-phosphate acyltransferase
VGRRTGRRRIGFWYRFAVSILRPPVVLLTRREWHGAEHLPQTGGVIVCTNHISYFDPLAFGLFVFDHGREPRYLAKSGLFHIPFVGRVLRGAGQIPVYRESASASQAYSAAVQAVREGGCVAIYPEATVTREPRLWPMVGKTGAARIALETGAPVVPVAQWGAQEVLAPYARLPRFLPRKTMHVRAGPPVDLSDLAGAEVDGEVLREVTERIMAAITCLLEEIRGEPAPAVRYDPRSAGVPATGDPNRWRAHRDRRHGDGRRSA